MNLARRVLVLALAATPSVSFLTQLSARPLSVHVVHAQHMSTSKTPLADSLGEKKEGELYRADGVRITHDPYAPGMAERYGLPGSTDSEGFDPYADTVGPGENEHTTCINQCLYGIGIYFQSLKILHFIILSSLLFIFFPFFLQSRYLLWFRQA